MKKTITLAAAAAFAGTAMAGGTSLTIDVSGAQSFGFQGNPINEIMSVMVGAGANITNIAWDVNLTTIGISWADENTMTFNGAVSVNPGAGDAFTVVNQNYQGSTATNLSIGMDGLLNIEFHEVGFDDNPGAVDSFYEAGSSVTIMGTGIIPTPGSLAIIGLGGLLAGRRRR